MLRPEVWLLLTCDYAHDVGSSGWWFASCLSLNQAAATALTSGCQCEEKEESGESRSCSLAVIPENQYPDGPDHFSNFSSMASRTKCNFWNCSWSLTLQLSAKDVPAGSVVKEFCTLFSKKLSPGHCLKLAPFSAKCDSEAPTKKFSLLLCQLCLFATTNIQSSNHLQFWQYESFIQLQTVQRPHFIFLK